jgi:uracil-DNA glycosylase family domain
VKYPGAEQYVPDSRSLGTLQAAAAGCEGCDLYQDASRTVFGRGQRSARLMLVGEQPGDVEDRQGKAFVGPAGRLLERALDAAGLADTPAYVTNAVKHFRFRTAGKRRIHEKPSAAQSTACRPWLAAELAAVRPTVLVALGATAAGSLFGPGFRLTPQRGVPLDWPPAKGDFVTDGTPVKHALATVHPSAVLRAPDGERDDAFQALVHDLQVAGELLG